LPKLNPKIPQTNYSPISTWNFDLKNLVERFLTPRESLLQAPEKLPGHYFPFSK